VDALHSVFNRRFNDILNKEIPNWILDPFSSPITEESTIQFQEELTELITNHELKFRCKSGYQQFWLQEEIPTA
jgi:hypothetical protein